MFREMRPRAGHRLLQVSLFFLFVLSSIRDAVAVEIRGHPLVASFGPPAQPPTPTPSPPPLSPPPEPAASVPLVRSEVVTLLSLRAVLGIRSKFWPRKTDPCDVWIGIGCENGHVVSISLTGLRRTVKGAMHPTFALEPLRNLTKLLRFNSSGFPLPGQIPDWIGTLLTLQVLDFTASSIASPIPSSLGNLGNLQILALPYNNLTDDIPASIGNLHSLTSLDLSHNNLSGSIPEMFSNLQTLQTLNLGYNQLTGNIPQSIGNLTSLRALMLSGNALQGSIPAGLGSITSLTSLDLSSNVLSGNIPISLGGLTSLLSLNLSMNFVNGSIPKELSNCISLQSLALDRNRLSGELPASLGSLSNISILSLSSNNLTGFLPSGFSGFAEAKQILLSENMFYGTVPFATENLTDIMILNLSSNYFEGSLPVPFIANAFLDSNCFANEANQRSIESCEMFYRQKGLSYEGSSVAPPPVGSVKGRNHIAPIVGGVLGALLLILVIGIIVFICVWRKKKDTGEQQREAPAAPKKGSSPVLPGNISMNLVCLGESFTYGQLQQATGGFGDANLLRSGHSGNLYQGVLEGGLAIVVKRIDLARYKKDGYLSELDIFAKASHTRLVPLLGHCFEHEEEKLLVYKFMPGRDLGYALHRRNSGNGSDETLPSLDWITRLKIAIGAAEGLTYLHHECTPPLVHRDIQASSILLDDKFEVRLGSLTEACVAVSDSHLGVISRILRRSQTSEHGEAGAATPTCAYDVYCFGKVLLELVSGKLGLSGSTDAATESWIDWALNFINVDDKDSISKILDPNLIVDEDLMEEVWAMSIVAKSCLNPKPSKRPLMRYILKALENPLKVVREDKLNGSGRSRASSHGSWNAALFGSWRHSSSETVAIPGSLREEHFQKNNLKQATNGGSQGSGGQGEVSQRRPGSSEIFPEPVEDSLAQAPTNTTSEKQDS